MSDREKKGLIFIVFWFAFECAIIALNHYTIHA
jgi:hypothetical protein